MRPCSIEINSLWIIALTCILRPFCPAVDFCSSNPCVNDGKCISLLTDFECNCKAQWQGKHCETGWCTLNNSHSKADLQVKCLMVT